MNTRELINRNVFFIFLCLLLGTLYFQFFLNRAIVQIDIAVTQKTDFKLYWAHNDQPFTEKNRAVVKISPDKTHYQFYLSDIGRIDKLRIDPMQYEGTATIKLIEISQTGYAPFAADLDTLQPVNQISESIMMGDGLRVVSTGGDPFLLLLPQFQNTDFPWGTELLRIVLMCALVIGAAKACAPLSKDFGYVVVMLSMILVLVVIMASISKRNAHPDEYVHLAATAYYQDHWLPPDVEDEAIKNTYSVYGMSRLNNGEIYYLLAGKVSTLFSVFNLEKTLTLRLFNVMLFSLIVLYAIASTPARAAALPFLVSPQIWYVFSYCGSDAFALFLCFIAVCEVIRQDSMLNRFLFEEFSWRQVLPAILLALLTAMLFLLKKNYYPFVALFYFALLIRYVSISERMHRSIFPVRLIILTLLALTLTAGRIGMDYYVNGLDRNVKMAAVQEETAHHWYKPSTPLDKKHVSLYKKERGIPLKHLVVADKWFEKSFNTGFGMYGYFTIAGSEIYYYLVKWSALFFVVYVGLTVLIRGSSQQKVLLVAVFFLALALVSVSLYHSWTKDFQAQGRYLFPIFSMVGLLLGSSRQIFETRMFRLAVGQPFLLGLYSFIFIALVSIPRS